MTSNETRSADAASAKARDAVRSAKDQAATETSHVLHDAKGRAAQVGDQVGAQAYATAAGLTDRAKGAIQGLSDRLPDDAITSGRRAYAQGSATVGRRVAKQPIEALLLAGALGYLLGWASSRS